MKGLELSERFWTELLRPALEKQRPELLARVAAGLCGGGSDCLGYDDALSRDHGFAAGCMVFISRREEREIGFALSTIYDRLPKEFLGFSAEHRSRQGDGRYGVKTIEGFFTPLTGTPGAPADWRQWLSIPESYLAQAVAGKVFYDGPGEFSRIRDEILHGMSEDVRLKKMAARAALMAQSGQYNFARCRRHGEEYAARLAAVEFVRESLGMIFLLNRRFMPYYKWAFRALRVLPLLAAEAESLEFLLSTDNSPEMAEEKYYAIEDLAAHVIGALQDQGLTEAVCGDLEKHAYSVNDSIADNELRARHILSAV